MALLWRRILTWLPSAATGDHNVVASAKVYGVPTERLSEYANRTLVGGEFGPRTGMSDARHVLRAIKGGRVKPEAGELYELVVKPLVEGLYDDARLT